MKVVRKVVKIIGIVLLVLVVLVGALLLYLSRRPAAPADYTKTTAAGGDIEAEYLSNGSFAVSVCEEPVLQGFKKYILYYPSELETSDKQYPVIVICDEGGTWMGTTVRGRSRRGKPTASIKKLTWTASALWATPRAAWA